MGHFDSICNESGMIIVGEQRLIPIAETSKDLWVPIGTAIAGSNDRGGTMDVPKRLDDAMKRLLELGKTFAYADERVVAAKVKLDNVLDEIRGDGSGATWNGKPVSFSLIDGATFNAVVATVRANGKTAWMRYAQLALGKVPPLPSRPMDKVGKPDPTTRRLAQSILDNPADEAPRKVLLDHLMERDDPHAKAARESLPRAKIISVLPVLGKLDVPALAALISPELPALITRADKRAIKPALVELARFMAWGTRLISACGENQITGYVASKPEYEYLDCFSKPYSDHAREKYAGMPELLPAIERNEKRFQERGTAYPD